MAHNQPLRKHLPNAWRCRNEKLDLFTIDALQVVDDAHHALLCSIRGSTIRGERYEGGHDAMIAHKVLELLDAADVVVGVGRLFARHGDELRQSNGVPFDYATDWRAIPNETRVR